MNRPKGQSIKVIGILAAVVCLLAGGPTALAADAVTPKNPLPRGGCPDLIDLIKELTPVVVNISDRKTYSPEQLR